MWGSPLLPAANESLIEQTIKIKWCKNHAKILLGQVEIAFTNKFVFALMVHT